MRPHFSVRRLDGIAYAMFAILLATIGEASARGFKFLEVKVVDPDGNPMADVQVEINIGGVKFPMPTNDEGIVSVNVPAGESSELELTVSHDGYASLKARWAKGNKIPEQFTIQLRKGTTIGGIVHQEDGKPVAGVKIEAIATAHDDNDIKGGKGELQMSIPRDLGVTDSEGRWQSNSAPAEDVAIQMKFTHPDYVSESGFDYRGGTWDELQSQKKIVVMQRGVIVAGKVVDQDQNPIANARIVTGTDRFLSDKLVVTTDQDGKYELPAPQVGRVMLTVTAAGFAPEIKSIKLDVENANTDFQLQPGNNIRLRVVDKEGNPLEGVRVYAEEWRGNRSLEFSGDEKTDEQGYWEWQDAPTDEIQYGFSKEGHMGLQVNLTAGEDIHTLTLNPVVVVRGKVIDKATKKPVESFKYVEGVWWEPNYDRYILQSSNVDLGKNGEFRFQMTSACAKFCVRVDAEGYRPLVSREIMPDEGEIEIDFELEKGNPISGVVLAHDGTPAQDATVALRSGQMPLIVSNGRLQQFSVEASVTTDHDGHFAFPVAVSRNTILVLHEKGWAELDNADEATAKQIELIPWSSVTGVMYQGGVTSPEERIVLQIGSDSDLNLSSRWYYSTTTSSGGKFRFDRLRAGPAMLYKVIRYAITGPDSWASWYSHAKPIEIKPGTSTPVKLGGEGRLVRGQLIEKEQDREQIDWNMGVVQLVTLDKADSKMGSDASYATAISADGTFRVFDVLPGAYVLKIQVYSASGSGAGDPVATYQQLCEVADGNNNEPVDLGSFTVSLVKSQD